MYTEKAFKNGRRKLTNYIKFQINFPSAGWWKKCNDRSFRKGSNAVFFRNTRFFRYKNIIHIKAELSKKVKNTEARTKKLSSEEAEI